MARKKPTEHDPAISSQLYENFRLYCSQHGESIRSVCEKLGISPSTTTKWKTGSSPDLSTLKKIADYFCISINELVGFQVDGNTTMVLTENESKLIVAYHMMSDVDRQIVDMLVAKYNTKRMFRRSSNEN